MKFIYFLVSISLSSCAYLHHVQYGEFESNKDLIYKPFDIKVNELGIDLQGAAATANYLSRSGKSGLGNALAILSLFQMGPRTGNPVYDKNYANNLIEVLYEKCPTGKVVNLISVRERRVYPYISGEIVKIVGDCVYQKGSKI